MCFCHWHTHQWEKCSQNIPFGFTFHKKRRANILSFGRKAGNLGAAKCSYTWVVYFEINELFIYKDKTTIHPNSKRGRVCLIFTVKSAVDFKAISLHSFSLKKIIIMQTFVPACDSYLWIWISVRGLLHKQTMGKKVTLYTKAPSVLFADYNACSH